MSVADDLRELLTEALKPFVAADVEKLRKDFLTLMKSVGKVSTYAEAVRLHTAIKTWNDRFDVLIFQQLVKGIPDAVQARMPGDESWAKYWEEKIRKECWTLHLEFRMPFEVANTDYWRKYNASWSPGQAKETGENSSLGSFLNKRDKWMAKVKRAAPKAWKVLNDYLEWLAAGKTTHTLEVPSDENMEMEGFKVRVYGADMKDWQRTGEKVIPLLKASLREYRARAMKVFPWVVRNQLPLELRFDCGLDWGGRYERNHILLCAFAFMEKPKNGVHVLAHEMGHHVWQAYLGGEAKEFWREAIKVDRGELDLVKLAGIWETAGGNKSLLDLEKLLKDDDPVLFLQVETLTNGYGNYGKSVFFSLEELKEMILKGTTTYPVPNNPITAYAAKNEEEAFCEAFGYLVAYGPRAVLPLVRRWLSIILPEIRVESTTMGSLKDDIKELRLLGEGEDSETPPQVKRCVAKVAAKEGGDTSKAFAICVANFQKTGQLKKGSMSLTKKGKANAKKKRAKSDHSDVVDDYEDLLKQNRKSDD